MLSKVEYCTVKVQEGYVSRNLVNTSGTGRGAKAIAANVLDVVALLRPRLIQSEYCRCQSPKLDWQCRCRLPRQGV